MQRRLHGWVRYAADGLAQRAAQQQLQQQQAADAADDGEDFIYNRIAVHSDDEDAEPHSWQAQRRVSAPELPAADGGGCASPPALEQQQHRHLPAVALAHLHCHSDGELLHLDSTGRHQLLRRPSDQQAPGGRLTRLESGDGPGWEADWGPEVPPAAGGAGAGSSSSASAQQGQQQQQQQQGQGQQQGEQQQGEQQQGGQQQGEQQRLPDEFDYSEDVPEHDHSVERRELLIYAVPLARGKVIFLPVCPWRTAPEEEKGWAKAVSGHMGRVQGQASDLWQRMASAEQGTVANRVYKLGKRVLESISPEERLMRGVPKNISRVLIYHPTQVSPDSIMGQMATMTKTYGLKAVGRAAAATVMLPLAVGIDLIILPGPQVLTYYTAWQLARNTNGALGTARMTKFITQGGGAENIRVNYVEEPRLDRFHDAANLVSPEGVLSEDDVDDLVAVLREPDLREPLMALRATALREAGRRTSVGGDEYVSLPPADPAAAAAAGGPGGSGGQGGGW